VAGGSIQNVYSRHHPYHGQGTNQFSAANREIQTMTKPKLSYFEQEDILHLVISEEEEANSIELNPNITAELNEKGELIGIEIVNASTFVRDAIMEGVQAKLLHLIPARK
jgi:uncharacterized protein YuzE